ncbi:MAG: hypothetical protein AAF604_09250 [Acidobacteriota bacterium]
MSPGRSTPTLDAPKAQLHVVRTVAIVVLAVALVWGAWSIMSRLPTSNGPGDSGAWGTPAGQNVAAGIDVELSSPSLGWTVDMSLQAGTLSFLEGEDGESIGLRPQLVQKMVAGRSLELVEIQVFRAQAIGTENQQMIPLSSLFIEDGDSGYVDLNDGDGPIEIKIVDVDRSTASG